MKTQLSTLYQRQTILKILIFTLVTAVIWVGLTLFRTQQRTEIDPELIKLSEPLNPNINTEVLSRIEAKKAYTPDELNDFPVYSIVTNKDNGEQVVIFNSSDRSKRSINLQTAAAASPTPLPSPSPQAVSASTKVVPQETTATASATPPPPIDEFPGTL